MDYEKAYKEALERAKAYYNELHNCRAKDELESIFPELVESEDERIRREIVGFICWAIDRGSITEEQRERSDTWLAYLEKQKEQKLVHEEELSKFCEANFNAGKRVVLNNPEEYGLQKPAEWSEEDEDNLKRVIRVLEDNDSDWKELTDWLKSLRPQPHWKPSEEQMEALGSAVKLYKDTHFEIFHERIVSLYEQLKKLM